MEPVKIFLSYSHKDEALMEELFEFLQPLVIAEKIKIWHDRAIDVGSLWDDEIKNALDQSDIIILLLSPSFLASSYINSKEIKKAFELRRTAKGKLSIVPVMVRPCDLQSHIVPNETYTIADFQGLPKNMLPVIKWETHEDAWIDVVAGLKKIINKLQTAGV